jgi:hypothetical protein
LRPFPRYAYKDFNSALLHCPTCCSPAPPLNLHTWVSLPTLLPFSLARSARPGRIRDSTDRSEPVGSTRYSRDPSQPGRSESAILIRVARVSQLDLIQSRSEPAGTIRVSQIDPSSVALSEPVRADPSLSHVRSSRWPLHPVRSSHDSHRSKVHYFKGIRGYRAMARRRRRAGAGGALSKPRGAAVRRGFNSRGRSRVVLG